MSNTFDIEFAKTQSPAVGGDKFIEQILKTSNQQLTSEQTKVAKELLTQRFERYTKTTSENRLF